MSTTTTIQNDKESIYTKGLFSFGLNGYTTNTQLFREFPSKPVFDVLYGISPTGQKQAWGLRAWATGSVGYGFDGSGNGGFIIEETATTITLQKNAHRSDDGSGKIMCVRITIEK
jgi:hypothetical protein